MLRRRDLRGTQPTLVGKRVLAVDDNDTNRRILAAYLDTWGMSVRMTGSPREALAWVEAGEAFDAGILDMHMPEMDGVTLVRAIRELLVARTTTAATNPMSARPLTPASAGFRRAHRHVRSAALERRARIGLSAKNRCRSSAICSAEA